MKKLKVETFHGGLIGPNAQQKLVDFVNENKISREDILKIEHPDVGGLMLYYYADDNQE